MMEVTASIKDNDVAVPLRNLLRERERGGDKIKQITYRSVYREILYLSIVSLERENIDVGKLKKKF